jgi:hypothetical protein
MTAPGLPITILTWQGTGVDMWTGFPAQVARATQNAYPKVFYWQPVGNWPASAYPMGPSVDAGVAEGQRLIQEVHTTGGLIPIGYSQGAICASHWWRDVVLNGPCQNRINDVIAAVTWGNPCRSPGIANGNAFAGWPMPAAVDGVVTGGIAGPDDLTPAQTPAFWYDFVNTIAGPNNNDLYTDAPTGTNPWTAEAGPGLIETQIYNIVQQATAPDIFAIISDALKVVDPATSVTEVLSIVEAIINGGLFAAQGGNAAHYTYDIAPAIAYLQQIGAKLS